MEKVMIDRNPILVNLSKVDEDWDFYTLEKQVERIEEQLTFDLDVSLYGFEV